ncbi:hypothetical protein [Streptomyces sp. HC307]|uniref:hypothetical protein n=1 Tax=Streptomyces flavusporus TaxID=3385496 RepID=UPI0039173136
MPAHSLDEDELPGARVLTPNEFVDRDHHPIICPVAEEHPSPTLVRADGSVRTVGRPAELAAGALTLTRVRELLSRHVEQRRKDGDERLHIVDGTTLFGPEDLSGPVGVAATTTPPDARKAALSIMRERPPTCRKQSRDDRI